MYTDMYIDTHIYIPLERRGRGDQDRHYGVATMSRLLKMIGLFCRISSLL